MPEGAVTKRTLGRIARQVEDDLLVVLLALMAALAVVQIVLRNLFDVGLIWADPLLRLMVLWLGLAGAAVASRESRQISIDVVSRLLPERGRAAVRVVTDLFTALVAGVLARHAARLVQSEHDAGTTAFAKVPAWLAEIVLPVAFAVIAWRYLAMTWRHGRDVLRRPG